LHLARSSISVTRTTRVAFLSCNYFQSSRLFILTFYFGFMRICDPFRLSPDLSAYLGTGEFPLCLRRFKITLAPLPPETPFMHLMVPSRVNSAPPRQSRVSLPLSPEDLLLHFGYPSGPPESPLSLLIPSALSSLEPIRVYAGTSLQRHSSFPGFSPHSFPFTVFKTALTLRT